MKRLNTKLLELYYYIPWPDCQMLSDLDPEQYNWNWSDTCHEFGAWAKKEWFDKINENNES